MLDYKPFNNYGINAPGGVLQGCRVGPISTRSAYASSTSVVPYRPPVQNIVSIAPRYEPRYAPRYEPHYEPRHNLAPCRPQMICEIPEYLCFQQPRTIERASLDEYASSSYSSYYSAQSTGSRGCPCYEDGRRVGQASMPHGYDYGGDAYGGQYSYYDPYIMGRMYDPAYGYGVYDYGYGPCDIYGRPY